MSFTEELGNKLLAKLTAIESQNQEILAQIQPKYGDRLTCSGVRKILKYKSNSKIRELVKRFPQIYDSCATGHKNYITSEVIKLQEILNR